MAAIAGAALFGAGVVTFGVFYGLYKAVDVSASAIQEHRRKSRASSLSEEVKEADQRRMAALRIHQQVQQSTTLAPHLMISGRQGLDQRDMEIVWSQNLFPPLQQPCVSCHMEWVDENAQNPQDHSLPPLPTLYVIAYDQKRQVLDHSTSNRAEFGMRLDPAAHHLALVLFFDRNHFTDYQRQHLFFQFRLSPAAHPDNLEDVAQIEAITSRGATPGQFPFFYRSLADLTRHDFYALSVLTQNLCPDSAETPIWSHTTLNHSFSPPDDNAFTYCRDFLLTPHLLCDASTSQNGVIKFSVPVRLTLICWDRLHRLINHISDTFDSMFPGSVTTFNLSDVNFPEICTFALLMRPFDGEMEMATIKTLEILVNEKFLAGGSHLNLTHHVPLLSGHRLIHHCRDNETTVVDSRWHLMSRLQVASIQEVGSGEAKEKWLRDSFGVPLVPLTVLEVTVHEAKGLAPKDSNGLSDPYVEITLEVPEEEKQIGSHFHYKTTRKEKTLNPVWDQAVMRFHLTSTCSLASPHVLMFRVMDYDYRWKSDPEGILTYQILEHRLPISASLPLRCDPVHPKEKVSGLLKFSIVPREEQNLSPLTPVDIKSRGSAIKPPTARSRSSSFRK